MKFRLLSETDFVEIHETFLAAFADYAVPVDFDADRLRRMLVRRGADLSASVGAFEGGRMVAVMATGVRDFEGIASGYDIFTGVRPEARGQRLAGRMFDVARAELEGRGVRRFVLEVIQDNTDAIRAYARAGFTTRRNFDCYEVRADALSDVRTPDGIRIRRASGMNPALWHDWRDWSPSWQNSDDSVADSVEEVVVLEAMRGEQAIGGAIVVPQARDLPQLAVAPDCRQQGVGSALLAAAVRSIDPDQTLRIINVDAAARADQAFFGRLGARSLPSQFEMVLDFAT